MYLGEQRASVLSCVCSLTSRKKCDSNVDAAEAVLRTSCSSYGHSFFEPRDGNLTSQCFARRMPQNESSESACSIREHPNSHKAQQIQIVKAHETLDSAIHARS